MAESLSFDKLVENVCNVLNITSGAAKNAVIGEKLVLDCLRKGKELGYCVQGLQEVQEGRRVTMA